jgi:hypothetical protein
MAAITYKVSPNIIIGFLPNLSETGPNIICPDAVPTVKIPRVIPRVPGSTAIDCAIEGIAGKNISIATGFSDEIPAISVINKIYLTGLILHCFCVSP